MPLYNNTSSSTGIWENQWNANIATTTEVSYGLSSCLYIEIEPKFKVGDRVRLHPNMKHNHLSAIFVKNNINTIFFINSIAKVDYKIIYTISTLNMYPFSISEYYLLKGKK